MPMTTTPTAPMNRRQFTAKRRALGSAARRRAAAMAALQLPKLARLLPRQAKVAIYLDDFGELPTAPLLAFCQRMGYTVYLPITYSAKPLKFKAVQLPIHKTPLRRHPLGMLEPYPKHIVPASQMDCIICPLVAVDKAGVRMGMGGGFYDRTFAITHHTLKVAWCYEFQVVDSLLRQPWDETVDVIISDKTIRFTS